MGWGGGGGVGWRGWGGAAGVGWGGAAGVGSRRRAKATIETQTAVVCVQ